MSSPILFQTAPMSICGPYKKNPIIKTMMPCRRGSPANLTTANKRRTGVFVWSMRKKYFTTWHCLKGDQHSGDSDQISHDNLDSFPDGASGRGRNIPVTNSTCDEATEQSTKLQTRDPNLSQKNFWTKIRAVLQLIVVLRQRLRLWHLFLWWDRTQTRK